MMRYLMLTFWPIQLPQHQHKRDLPLSVKFPLTMKSVMGTAGHQLH